MTAERVNPFGDLGDFAAAPAKTAIVAGPGGWGKGHGCCIRKRSSEMRLTDRVLRP